jgi:hypothetical protein
MSTEELILNLGVCVFGSGTITQLFGVGESECSVIFVWVYALASVAVTVWSAFFMWTLS